MLNTPALVVGGMFPDITFGLVTGSTFSAVLPVTSSKVRKIGTPAPPPMPEQMVLLALGDNAIEVLKAAGLYDDLLLSMASQLSRVMFRTKPRKSSKSTNVLDHIYGPR